MSRARTDRSGALGTRRAAAISVIVPLLVLTACLGPNEFDPTGTAPIGRLDLVHADGASIRLVGWALDPDTLDPIDVVISVRQQGSTHRADRPRPDVAAAIPTHGPNHGFDIRTQPLPPGLNEVCIWAPNVGRGTRDRILGCTEVRTGTDDPIGRFDTLTEVDGGTIRARGWAYDAEAGGSIEVTPRVNGVVLPSRVADVPRPDVARAVRKPGNYGFSIDIPVPPGDHRVCVTARNVGRGSDQSLGCRDRRVNSSPSILPGLDLTTVERVGPPAGHPLELIDRDAGVSTRLQDGSTLWLFGDSTEKRSDGSYRYFVNNTAAWAAADTPTVTRDAVTSEGRPQLFVAPSAPFLTPCGVGRSPVQWPISVVAVPLPDGGDRVLAFMGNVCLGAQLAFSRGVALVEWLHDPSSERAGVPIVGTVLNQELFPAGKEYGTASVLHDGMVHVYECGRPGDQRPPGTIIWPDDPDYRGCTVGRVEPGQAHDAEAYRYWTGGDDWSEDRDAAVTMEMPVGNDGNRQSPVVSFSVVDDPHHGWTMVYSPWPGYTEEVAIRSGAGPTGPWSAWRVIRTPGCNEWADGDGRFCYAATAQPWRSTPTELGIGYYDQLVGLEPTRGSYLAGGTPFERLAIG